MVKLKVVRLDPTQQEVEDQTHGVITEYPITEIPHFLTKGTWDACIAFTRELVQEASKEFAVS